MTISLQIESDNGLWILAANYCEVKKKYYGVSLTNPVDGNSWDNVYYIYKELYPMVFQMLLNRPTVAVTDENLEVYDYLCENRDDIVQLHQIIAKSVELGWNKIS